MDDKDKYLEKEFDFSKAVKNPYARELKQQITIKVAPSTIEYFKKLSAETSIPYQTLINMYLTDCVKNKRTVNLSWT